MRGNGAPHYFWAMSHCSGCHTALSWRCMYRTAPTDAPSRSSIRRGRPWKRCQLWVCTSKVGSHCAGEISKHGGWCTGVDTPQHSDGTGGCPRSPNCKESNQSSRHSKYFYLPSARSLSVLVGGDTTFQSPRCSDNSTFGRMCDPMTSEPRVPFIRASSGVVTRMAFHTAHIRYKKRSRTIKDDPYPISAIDHPLADSETRVTSPKGAVLAHNHTQATSSYSNTTLLPHGTGTDIKSGAFKGADPKSAENISLNYHHSLGNSEVHFHKGKKPDADSRRPVSASVDESMNESVCLSVSETQDGDTNRRETLGRVLFGSEPSGSELQGVSVRGDVDVESSSQRTLSGMGGRVSSEGIVRVEPIRLQGLLVKMSVLTQLLKSRLSLPLLYPMNVAGLTHPLANESKSNLWQSVAENKWSKSDIATGLGVVTPALYSIARMAKFLKVIHTLSHYKGGSLRTVYGDGASNHPLPERAETGEFLSVSSPSKVASQTTSNTVRSSDAELFALSRSGRVKVRLGRSRIHFLRPQVWRMRQPGRERETKHLNWR